jgi:hypothetical protein
MWLLIVNNWFLGIYHVGPTSNPPSHALQSSHDHVTVICGARSAGGRAAGPRQHTTLARPLPAAAATRRATTLGAAPSS